MEQTLSPHGAAASRTLGSVSTHPDDPTAPGGEGPEQTLEIPAAPPPAATGATPPAAATGQAPPAPAKLVPVGGGIAWRLILVLVLALALVVFAVQNTDPVDLRFLGWSWNVPLAVVLVGIVAVTVLLDEFLGFWWRRRHARSTVRRREEKAEEERARKTREEKARER